MTNWRRSFECNESLLFRFLTRLQCPLYFNDCIGDSFLRFSGGGSPPTIFTWISQVHAVRDEIKIASLLHTFVNRAHRYWRCSLDRLERQWTQHFNFSMVSNVTSELIGGQNGRGPIHSSFPKSDAQAQRVYVGPTFCSGQQLQHSNVNRSCFFGDKRGKGHNYLPPARVSTKSSGSFRVTAKKSLFLSSVKIMLLEEAPIL